MENIMRNPYVVLLFCLLFAFFSSYAIEIDSSMYIAIFILAVIMTFLIRPVRELYMKSTAYLSLGMLAYWMISKDLVLSSGGPKPALFILFGLTILNSLVSLVSYYDGKMAGHAFSAGSLALLFLNLRNPYTFFTVSLIFLSSHVIVYFISRIKERRQISEKVLKAALFSSVFLYISSIFQIWTGISCGVYSIPNSFVFCTSIIYLIALSAFMVWSSLQVFEFFLAHFRYVRKLEGEFVVFYPIDHLRKPKNKTEQKTKKKKA